MDESGIKPLTVGQLIEKLKGVNPEATITMEGCDCDADAYRVDTDSTTWDGKPNIYLGRHSTEDSIKIPQDDTVVDTAPTLEELEFARFGK